MYLIPASPYTKIFVPEFRDQLVETPEKIADDTYPFTFHIPFGTGAVGPFTFRALTRLDDLPCIKRRDPADTPALYNLLTGGPTGQEYPGAQEMDAYGLAAVILPHDVTALNLKIIDLKMAARASGDKAALERAEAEAEELQKAIEESIQSARTKAKQISDTKVMNQIKRTYERLKHQWSAQKERGEGNHEAASSEACCMFVLSDLIKASSEKKQKMNAQIAELMNFIQTTKV